MAVLITTPIPTLEETAKRLGVSKKRALELARYAEYLAKSGNDSAVREDRKTRRAPSPEQTLRMPARTAVTVAKKKATKRPTVSKKD